MHLHQWPTHISEFAWHRQTNTYKNQQASSVKACWNWCCAVCECGWVGSSWWVDDLPLSCANSTIIMFVKGTFQEAMLPIFCHKKLSHSFDSSRCTCDDELCFHKEVVLMVMPFAFCSIWSMFVNSNNKPTWDTFGALKFFLKRWLECLLHLTSDPLQGALVVYITANKLC